MQIIGIDYDDKMLRCGRIQNAEKPEFVKLKQFPANNKGIKSLDAWLDECCSKDHSSMLIALVVEEQEGASLAYRYHQLGYAIAPMTFAGIGNEIRKDKCHKSVCELVAQKATSWKMRWNPLTKDLLEIRSYLIQREMSRIECLHNQAKNELFEAQAFDFLIQLTQNAAQAHASNIENAEKSILAGIAKNSGLKGDYERLMTIPGMTEMAAASLVYVFHAYPTKSSESFVGMLKLSAGEHHKKENFRSLELKIARMELYDAAVQAMGCVSQVQSMCYRLENAQKPIRSIEFAACHKLGKLAFALMKAQENYRG